MRFSSACFSVAFVTLALTDKASSSQVDTIDGILEFDSGRNRHLNQSKRFDALDTIVKVNLPDRSLSQASKFGNYYKGASAAGTGAGSTAWCNVNALQLRGPQVSDASDCEVAYNAFKNDFNDSEFEWLGNISSPSEDLQKFFGDTANNSDVALYPTGCYMRDGNIGGQGGPNSSTSGKYFAFISNSNPNTNPPNGNASIKPVCHISSCATDPCQNGGTCSIDANNAFTCTCAPGYNGGTCEDYVCGDESNPCKNDGICSVNTNEEPVCDCSSTNFVGLTCEDEPPATPEDNNTDSDTDPNTNDPSSAPEDNNNDSDSDPNTNDPPSTPEDNNTDSDTDPNTNDPPSTPDDSPSDTDADPDDSPVSPSNNDPDPNDNGSGSSGPGAPIVAGGSGPSTPVSEPVPEPDLCDSLNCPRNQCRIDENGEPYCRCENTWVYVPSEKKCECPGGTTINENNNRCEAPTSAPIPSPVDPAVAAFPVDPPIDPPVAAFPTPKSPTMSPVASASSGSDDPDFTFPLLKQTDGNGGYERGDCEWLSKNKMKEQIRKDTYCAYTHVYSMCQKSCANYFGASDITDTSGDNVFKLEIGTKVPCNWLSKNMQKRDIRRAAYCIDSSVCEMASQIGTLCPEACGFTNGAHEYRKCPEPEAEPEPVIGAIPAPPTAPVPVSAPSAPSKGYSTGNVPSAPSKGYATGSSGSAPTKGYVSTTTTSSGKGLSKGNSKGNSYAPAMSGKGYSKGSDGRRLRSRSYLRK